MANFLDLPAELILHALWFLDLEDVLACQISHPSLHSIIKDSILLQYLNALKAAGMEDNRLCSIGNISERLRLLNVRENSWAGHLIDFSRKIASPQGFQLLVPIGLDGGMYFFSDSNSSSSLHYVPLPSKVSDKLCWNRIDVVDKIVSIGLAVHEHNLIAIGTRIPDGQGLVAAEILFFEASTGNPHPLVRIPKISIPHIPIEIKIAENHLALVTYKDVEIYEWKTGVLKMTIPSNAHYGSSLFLSPKVLLLPNRRNNTLEFWNIPESPIIDPTQTFLNGALALPPIDHISGTVVQITCHGEKSSESYFDLPFYSSSADAIAIFNISIAIRSSGRCLHFPMAVHYRSLLQIYSTSFSPLEEFSARTGALPWDDWGPPVTRLLSSHSDQVPCFSGANQRYALRKFGNDITILDFNPIRIQRLSAVIPKYAKGKKEDMLQTSIITNESRLNHHCFKKCITSRLPYAQHIFQNTSDFPAFVAIDDERLVQFRYNHELEVLHIGQAASVMAED